MDSADLLERGARSLIVDLCKQLEEVVTAVPNLKRFAYSLSRESVGMLPAGRKMGSRNGDSKKRLLAQLETARKTRKTRKPNRVASGRRPLTTQEKADVASRFRARWAEAKRLGYTGRTLPSNKILNKLRAKSQRKAPPPTNGGTAAE